MKQQGKSSLCSQASSFPHCQIHLSWFSAALFLVSSQAKLMQIAGKWDLCQCSGYLIFSVDSQLWWFLLPVCLLWASDFSIASVSPVATARVPKPYEHSHMTSPASSRILGDRYFTWNMHLVFQPSNQFKDVQIAKGVRVTQSRLKWGNLFEWGRAWS